MDAINPGIRRTVAWLRSIGFDTTDSGDGKTHDHDCDRPVAYVAIRCAPSDLTHDAVRLWCALNERGVEVKPIGEDATQPAIQATFDPANGIALIDLVGVDDALLFDADDDAGAGA